MHIGWFDREAVAEHGFQIRRRLHASSTGSVYLATGASHPQLLIIKARSAAHCGSTAHSCCCQSLASEATTLRLLAEYEIPAPRCLRFFHAQHRAYLVMSYLPGRTLAERVGVGTLSPRSAVSAAAQVAGALHDVHQLLGYAHQDVKLSNIIVRRDGVATLIDWGSATPFTQASRRNPCFTGTRGYMPLSQMRGEVRPENDLFALAVTLREAVRWPTRTLRRIIQRVTDEERGYRDLASFQADLHRLMWLDRYTNRIGLRAL